MERDITTDCRGESEMRNLFRILDEARASVMIGEGLHTDELYRLIASDLTIDKTWRQAVDIMRWMDY